MWRRLVFDIKFELGLKGFCDLYSLVVIHSFGSISRAVGARFALEDAVSHVK